LFYNLVTVRTIVVVYTFNRVYTRASLLRHQRHDWVAVVYGVNGMILLAAVMAAVTRNGNNTTPYDNSRLLAEPTVQRMKANIYIRRRLAR